MNKNTVRIIFLIIVLYNSISLFVQLFRNTTKIYSLAYYVCRCFYNFQTRKSKKIIKNCTENGWFFKKQSPSDILMRRRGTILFQNLKESHEHT